MTDGSRSEKVGSRLWDKGHAGQFEAIAEVLRAGGSALTGPDPLATMGVALRGLAAARGFESAD